MLSAVAAHNFGVGPCRKEMCGEMLKAMARVAPLQPNEAMARIAPRRDGTFSLDPFPSKVLWTRFEIVLEAPKKIKMRIRFGCSKKG
jgi:hypothetical protein